MKRFFLLLTFLVTPITILAEIPDLVVAGYEFDSPRGAIITKQMDYHFNNIFSNLDFIDYINPQDFRKYLIRDNLLNREQILQRSSEMNISITIFATIIDKNDTLHFSIIAFGNEFPHNGEIIAQMNKSITKIQNPSAKKYNLLSEDLCLQFSVKLLNNFKFPIKATSSSDSNQFYSKQYDTYGKAFYTPIDKFISKNSYYVKNYKNKSNDLNTRFYINKKKLIFQGNNLETNFFTALSTPLLSTITPISAPFSYISNNDYSSLGLFIANSSPYYYIASQTYLRYPPSMIKNNQNISKLDNTFYYFTLYHTFSGGISFFIDSTATYALHEAGQYNSKIPYIGDEHLAIYFSIISGGGGHFYKGHRFKGILYYHLNNLTLLSGLYFISEKMSYSNSEQKYHSSGKDIKKASLCFSAFVILKTIEVIDIINTPFNTSLGKEDNTHFSFSIIPQNDETTFGLSISKEF